MREVAGAVRHGSLPRGGILLLAVFWLFAPVLSAADGTVPNAEDGSARRILETAGIKGGLIVHVGCGDGKLTASLQAADRYLVHGLDTEAANVEEARAHIRARGLYGRVSVDRFNGRQLPYCDNLANLIVAEDLGGVPMDEVMRVLCPGGVACTKQGEAWTKTVKPWPKDVDEWTHTLYDASGNAVGRDMVVGPPDHVQWVGEPRRARQHERLASISAVVSAGGRVFSIQDQGSIASILLPANWLLVARDAFNGVVLWKRPLDPWEEHLRGFRNGPPEIARRLVAIGRRVYVTPGYGKAVCALDAATGETVKRYDRTGGTSEILWHQGVLLLVAADVDAQRASEAARRRGSSRPSQNVRILAVNAESGDLLWKKSDADTAELMPNTLAAGDGRVVFQNSSEVVCLDSATGEVTWRAARVVSVKRPGWSSPTLVIYGDVVLSADRAAPGVAEKEPGRIHKASWVNAPAGRLYAFSAASGEKLWSCPCRECFNAPVDVLVAGGLVWTGELVLRDDPGITAGRDPKTGEIKTRRPADQEFFQVGMPHHRCYRNRATQRYLLLGRAGVEFVDLASGEAVPHHWTRGTCQHGILPCNGLLYVPPHSCACYSRAKLNGFLALAPKQASGADVPQSGDNHRLVHGPAFEKVDGHRAATGSPQGWPTYRHDGARSGCTTVSAPCELKPAWIAEPGGALSGVTIAQGKVFVASIDTHTVHALDVESGRLLWHYTAGGRVDSPPTICNGLALFGSADGYVYCLRAADGILVWRFRAAPEDRRVVAYGQLESSWPVHGSVLVDEGVVSFAAGRSSYLSGGIRLIRLDVKTGEKLSETTIDSRDPKTGRQPKGSVKAFDLPGALPDVLATDGTSLYMRHLRFDRRGQPQDEEKAHLFSPTGLLDDSWWHRSYWIFGSRFYTGYRDWFRAGREVPGGRILSFDDSCVYGFGRTPAHYYWSTPLEYHLFATGRNPKIIESDQKRPRIPAWGQRQIEYDWSRRIPLQARALVLAAGTLFVAGPPDIVDEEKAYRSPDDVALQARLAEQGEALGGGKGAKLLAVSASDGKTLGETRLDSPPTWDGMAVAHGRLYLSTQDGKVVCFAGR